MRYKNKHNVLVRKIAGGYLSQGYKVNADVPSYNPPRNTWRQRSDIIASKGRDKVMIEVETPSSIGTDYRQRQILRKYAHRYGYRFRTARTR